MPDINSNRFDEQLRGKANRYRKEPPGRVWEQLQAGMAEPAPRKNYRAAGLLLLGLLLVLLGNVLPRLSELSLTRNTPAAEANQPETALSGRFSEVSQPPKVRQKVAESQPVAPVQTGELEVKKHRNEPVKQKSPNSAFVNKNKQTKPAQLTDFSLSESEIARPVVAAVPERKTALAEELAEVKTEEKHAGEAAVPAVFQALLNTEQEMHELGVTESPEAAENPALVRAIRAQKLELEKLQLRADSLLALYLPEPAENYLLPLPSDSLVQPKPKHLWSAALAVAPELNFMHLSAPATDTLLEMRRNHESGRAGASAALSLEYQLSNKLRIGAGIGYSTYGAELRLTNTQTLLNVRYDTATQITTQHYTNTHTNYIVQQDSTAVMDPIFNQSGQVIGYNTVYVTHPDTTWHTVTVEGTDTIRVQTITPLIHQTQKTTYRKLKPQYHFITLPIMLYYKLTTGKRWWAEAGAGGQLQLFRGAPNW